VSRDRPPGRLRTGPAYRCAVAGNQVQRLGSEHVDAGIYEMARYGLLAQSSDFIVIDVDDPIGNLHFVAADRHRRGRTILTMKVDRLFRQDASL
jgi:hypothetical protein